MTTADDPRPEDDDLPTDGTDGADAPAADDSRPQVEGDVESEAAPPRRPDVDVEAAWADIVARWGDVPDTAAEVRRPPRPSGREGAPGRRVVREPGPSGGLAGGERGTPGPPGAQEAPTGPPSAPDARGDDAPGRPTGADDDVVGWEDRPAGPTADERPPVVPEDEGHYEPPPPAPAPPTDRVTRVAWVGALAGPALLLLCALVWRDAPTLVVLGAVAAFVAGFAVLVSRLPRSRDDDDDGAVV